MAKIKRNKAEIYRSVAMSVGLGRVDQASDDFRVRNDSGEYKVKDAVYFVEDPGIARYIINVKQTFVSKPSRILILRKDCVLNTVNTWDIEATNEIAVNSHSTSTTVPIHKLLEKIAPIQLAMLEEESNKQVFNELWNSPKINSHTLTKASALSIKMLYKSEQTHIDGRPFKIIVFRVIDTNRNDYYILAVPQTNTDADFKRLMGMYRSAAYGQFINYALKTVKNKILHKVDQSMIDNGFAVCLTRPKSDEGIEDITFTALRPYFYFGAETNISNITYINISNDDGEEVSRKANYFFVVKEKRRV